jgi:hypothetical protein
MTGENHSRAQQELNVSNLAKGMYTLLLEANTERASQKIIIK